MATPPIPTPNTGYFISKFVTLIAKNPIQTTPIVVPLKEAMCCGDEVWRVLADTGSNDEFKNDVNSFLWAFDKIAVTGAILFLVSEDGSEIDLTSNTDYGTPLDFNTKFNNQNETFVGYKLEWKKIIDDLGEGLYNVRCDIETTFNTTQSLFSDNYCLKQYSLQRADKTVRVEYIINGILGNSEFDTDTRDFAQMDWYNSHRFDGNFIFGNGVYETEYVQYQNRQKNYTKDELEKEYLLSLKPIPAFKHDLLMVDILMSDYLQITDYNTNNIAGYVKKAVKKSSGYDPKFYPMRSKLGSVELKFKQEYNNHKKFRN